MKAHLAMWSGPRNISTALLRAWGNRPDTYVTDEPLYAHYLLRTGLSHPGAAEVIASQETDWRKVATWLTGPTPEGKTVWYQKHMAHHLLPEMEGAWLDHLSHCFLIRDPREMLPSLARFLPSPTLADTGLPQQVSLIERMTSRRGVVPPVLDACDVLQNPEAMLRRLCDALGVPFTPAMLAWPPGRRETDGVWAKYWYAAVERSTTFEPSTPKTEPLALSLQPLYEQCRPLYETLHTHRLAEG